MLLFIIKLRLFVNRNSVTKLEEDNMSSYNATTDYLKSYGINNPKAIYLNMPTEALYEEAIKRGEGHVVKGGAMVFDTGAHTGRSAQDKYVVREATSEKDGN